MIARLGIVALVVLLGASNCNGFGGGIEEWVNVCVHAPAPVTVDELSVTLPYDDDYEFLVHKNGTPFDLPASFSISWDRGVLNYQRIRIETEDITSGNCIQGEYLWIQGDGGPGDTGGWISVSLDTPCGTQPQQQEWSPTEAVPCLP